MPEASRILVVKLSALGDLFHAVPVVHLLKQAYKCPVDWVTQPEYVDLVRCHRDVDRVLAFPRRGGWAERKAFARALRKESYDLAVDLQGLTKSGLVLALARAERKVAPSRRRELSWLLANERVPARQDSRHALQGLLDSLRYLEVPTQPIRYPLTFPNVDALPGEGPRLGIAPQSRWAAKDWPEERFVELVKRLRETRPWQVVLLGGPADCQLVERLASEMGPPVVNLCGARTLPGLGSVLQQLDVVLCNDSGPMHYAAAVGTPLVALFGPTDPALTGPWGEGHEVIRAKPGPEGYPDPRSYKTGDRSWISKITVAQVAAAVERQYEKRKR
jgi:ADP-heptose:LPS heptosyltransferase